MKPTLSNQGQRLEVRCRLLAPGWRVKDIADACRSAALAFAWCAHRAWNRRELARWLVGPYAAAIGSEEQTRPRRAAGPTPIQESTITELLVRTHEQILGELRHCHSWQDDPSFARDMVDNGLVIGVVDETDAIGYAPMNVWNMHLVDRVRSLFIADYLSRPDEYASFSICEGCGGATFDGAESHRATCPEATPASGLHSLVLRRRRSTLPGVGEESEEAEDLAIELTRARGERRRRTTLDFGDFADQDFDDDDALAVDLTAELNAAIRAA